MHDEAQDVCPVIWNIFHEKSNVKSRVYENIFKIFPNRDHIPIPYLWTHFSIWICLHKNHQRNVFTKTGSHYSIKSAYFSLGVTRILSSALHNWTLGTLHQKNKILPLCGWFWIKIFYQRWCKLPSRLPKKALCNFKRLGGSQLTRIDNRLELWRRIFWHIDSRICEESAG